MLDYCADGHVERVEATYSATDPSDHIVKRLRGACLVDFQANRSRYRVLLRPPSSAGATETANGWTGSSPTARPICSTMHR